MGFKKLFTDVEVCEKQPLFIGAKKGFIVLCFLFMMVALMGQTAYEALYVEAAAKPTGAGTELSPYLIGSVQNLWWVSAFPGGPEGWYKAMNEQIHFKLTADIDFDDVSQNWPSDQAFRPIGYGNTYGSISGTAHYFCGVFDGAGYTISNITIEPIATPGDPPTGGMVTRGGLFSVIYESEIKNLHLRDVTITGFHTAGGIAGEVFDSTIEFSSTTGNITIEGVRPSDGNSRGGGLVGFMNASPVTDPERPSKITESFSIVNIDTDTATNPILGGLVGLARYSEIEYSFSRGDLSGEHLIGGILGRAQDFVWLESNFYAGLIDGVDGFIGGIVGSETNSQFYTNFWDLRDGDNPEVAVASGNGTVMDTFGRPTGLMKLSSTYIGAGWDFVTTWSIGALLNDGYPYSMNIDIDVIPVTDIDFTHPRPTDLVAILTRDNLTGEYIVLLTWSIPTPQYRNQISHFRVYRNDKPADTPIAVNVDTTTYEDDEITNGNTYIYTVRAVYQDSQISHHSTASDPIIIMLPPYDLESEWDGSDLKLTWKPPIDPDNNITGYNVYRNDENTALNLSPLSTSTLDFKIDDIDDHLGDEHVYQVRVIYGSLGESEPAELLIKMPTFPPPRFPVAVANGNNIVLTWDIPHTDLCFATLRRYEIWKRNNHPDSLSTYYRIHTTATPAVFTFTDNNAITDVTYSFTYRIIAEYLSPNGFSDEKECVTTIQITDPQPPAGVEAKIGVNYVHLTWSMPGTPDKSSRNTIFLLGFNVWRTDVLTSPDFPVDYELLNDDDVLILQTEYRDYDATNNKSYIYVVEAIYSDGTNETEEPSEPTYQIDVRYPVNNLTATLVGQTVRLNWVAPPDDEADGYIVYRGSSILTTSPTHETTLEFVDLNPNKGVFNLYTVVAFYNDDEDDTNPDHINQEVSIFVSSLPTPVPAPPIIDGNNVELRWEAPETIQGLDVLLGYKVYRNDTPLTPVAITTLNFADNELPYGTYLYKLTAIYEQGESEPAEVEVLIDDPSSEGEPSGVVTITELYGNFPNPFNPLTVISFSLENAGHVIIDIFNIRGQKVYSLINATMPSGEHQITWYGTDEHGRAVDSGIYFYRMQTEDFSAVRRMVLLK
ncbi:MAG: T9SS type A sorting domain-containing protein [Candidatus Cloacimonetes bacterium]|nr:T9SS type A sorting domain-containing protein [Candidatus Cloacimonadota bacterium]